MADKHRRQRANLLDDQRVKRELLVDSHKRKMRNLQNSQLAEERKLLVQCRRRSSTLPRKSRPSSSSAGRGSRGTFTLAFDNEEFSLVDETYEEPTPNRPVTAPANRPLRLIDASPSHPQGSSRPIAPTAPTRKNIFLSSRTVPYRTVPSILSR